MSWVYWAPKSRMRTRSRLRVDIVEASTKRRGRVKPEPGGDPLGRHSGRLGAMVPDIRIPVARVGPVSVPLPQYQSEGAAGMDLHAALEGPLTLDAGGAGARADGPRL